MSQKWSVPKMHESDDFKTPSYQALSGVEEVRNSYSSEEFLLDASKIIAFYLPQYHEVKENSEWWGKGFTDWVNVAKARKLYVDHYQPQIPQELGFYDLSNIETIEKQAHLATSHGVHGFCFYWYWFNGRKVLEKPISLLRESHISINFCVCWANDSWARTWDHNPKEILIEQTYPDGFEKNFIADLLVYWEDDRYINIDGRPLLLIYRIASLPNPSINIQNLRTEAIKTFGKDPYIVGVDFYDIDTENTFGLDALVEFPPHKFWAAGNQISSPATTSTEFTGKFVDYKKVMVQSISRSLPKHSKVFRTIIPAWDNTARLGNRSVIIQNTNPVLFGRWLSALRQSNRENLQQNERLIFVNAWNEWAEGAHLEPDLLNGRAFLEQILKSQCYFNSINYLDLEDISRQFQVEIRNTHIQAYFSASYYQSSNSNLRKLGDRVYGFSPYLYRFVRKGFLIALNLRDVRSLRGATARFLFNLSPPTFRVIRFFFKRTRDKSRE